MKKGFEDLSLESLGNKKPAKLNNLRVFYVFVLFKPSSGTEKRT